MFSFSVLQGFFYKMNVDEIMKFLPSEFTRRNLVHTNGNVFRVNKVVFPAKLSNCNDNQMGIANL